jgi:hypothetical protein
MRAQRESIRSSENARRLLAKREPDGTIRANPYQKWQGAHWTLHSLDLIAYPPGDQGLLPLRDQMVRWLFSPRFLKFPATLILPGQEERPRRCASQEGNAILYFMGLGLGDPARADDPIHALAQRLVDFQWPDGGWNCDKRPEAHTSSFIETLIPLRALSRYSQAYPAASHASAARKAAERAAEFLLQRRLMYRLHDGALIHPTWGGAIHVIHHPFRFYDLLFALLVMAEMGKIHDPRCADALEWLKAKQLPDGGFPAEERNCKTTDSITTRGSLADWGPSGSTRSNPFVTIDALWVMRMAGLLDHQYKPQVNN